MLSSGRQACLDIRIIGTFRHDFGTTCRNDVRAVDAVIRISVRFVPFWYNSENFLITYKKKAYLVNTTEEKQPYTLYAN